MSNANEVQSVELLAGRHPNGEMIIERVTVEVSEQPAGFRLLASPVFVRGIAKGDIIEPMAAPQGAFKICQHGGNLCVRVFSRADNSLLEQALTSELEKLGGNLDLSQPRVLVYSVHVSCGFQAVEEILNRLVGAAADHMWVYGNVYDPETQEPLDWWQPILAPQ